MGVTVRQKGKTWYVFITHQGRRRAKAIGDRRAAEQVASQLRAKLALGDLQVLKPSQGPGTFREYSERWLESYARLQCRQSTYENYRRVLRQYAFPRFGTMRLDQVGREDLKHMIAGMAMRGLSKSSIKGALAPIRELYYHAIDDGHHVENPAARIGRFLKDKGDPRLKIFPLTGREVEQLLEAAAADDEERAGTRARDAAPSLWLFLLCAARSGLRLGEILGLQWGDLDFQGRFIEVRRQWTKRRIQFPKNGKIRRVDMSDQLGEAFREARGIREAELAIAGREFDPDEPIFRNGAGGRLDDSRVSKIMLRRCLLRADLRQIRFHDLRHTFASLLLANGESPVYVKEQLGHHSIQITVDTYGHLIPGSNRAAVNRLDPTTICNPRATPHEDLTPSKRGTQQKESVGGGVWGSNPPARYPTEEEGDSTPSASYGSRT